MHDNVANGSISTTNAAPASLPTFENACCDESIASTVERVMRTILKNDSCKSSNTKVLSSTQKRKGLSIAGKAKRVAKGLHDFEFVEFEPIDNMSSSGAVQTCSVVQPTSSASSRKEQQQHQQHHCAGTAATIGTCGGNIANVVRDSQRCVRPAAEVVDEIEPQQSKAKRRKRDKSDVGKNNENNNSDQTTTKATNSTAALAPKATTDLVKTSKANSKSKSTKRPQRNDDNDGRQDNRNQSDDTDAPKAKKSKKYEKKSNDVVDHSVRGRNGNSRDKREPSASTKCGTAAKSSATKTSSSRSKRQENEKTTGVSLPTTSAKVSNCSAEKGASHTTTTTTTTTRRIQFVRSNENAIADFELVDVRLQEAFVQGLMSTTGSLMTHNGTKKSNTASATGTTTTTATGSSAATPSNSSGNSSGSKPRKPAPSAVVTLALRAIVPRGLMPNETCVLYANVHVKPNVLCGVELHVYGNGDLHTSYETSLLDAKRGGLTVCVQNLSSSYKNVGVGDIIGYLELRALDETMKLSV